MPLLQSPLAFWDTPLFQILVLLATGHVFADFVFQTATRVQLKRSSWKALLRHGLEVGVIHWIVLSFGFLTLEAIVTVLAISILHVIIDAGKVQVEKRWDKVTVV